MASISRSVPLAWSSCSGDGVIKSTNPVTGSMKTRRARLFQSNLAVSNGTISGSRRNRMYSDPMLPITRSMA